MMRTGLGLLLAMLALSDRGQGDALWETVDGWGIPMLIMALGLGGIFFLMRERNAAKCTALSIYSWILAIFTVLGKSYLEAGNWNYIFDSGLQLCRAVFVGGGGHP